MRYLTLLLALLLPFPVTPAERDYQQPWCNAHKGAMEVPVPGGRIDCLTDRYAVEVDFAPKWKECIAQARWYGLQTGAIPGCVLIIQPGDKKYVEFTEDYLHGTDIYIKIWTTDK